MTDNLTDQGLAQLMASLGYPVPQSINQGRHLMARKSQMADSADASSAWVGSSWNGRCYS